MRLHPDLQATCFSSPGLPGEAPWHPVTWWRVSDTQGTILTVPNSAVLQGVNGAPREETALGLSLAYLGVVAAGGVLQALCCVIVIAPSLAEPQLHHGGKAGRPGGEQLGIPAQMLGVVWRAGQGRAPTRQLAARSWASWASFSLQSCQHRK